MSKTILLLLLISLLLVSTLAVSRKVAKAQRKQDDEGPGEEAPAEEAPAEEAPAEEAPAEEAPAEEGPAEEDTAEEGPEEGPAEEEPSEEESDEGEAQEEEVVSEEHEFVGTGEDGEWEEHKPYRTTLDDVLGFDPETLRTPECASGSEINAKLVELNTWIFILSNPDRLAGDVEVLKRVLKLIQESKSDNDYVEETPFSFVQLSSRAEMRTSVVQRLYGREMNHIFTKLSQLRSAHKFFDKRELIQEIVEDLDNLIDVLSAVITRRNDFPVYIEQLKQKVAVINEILQYCKGPVPKSISIKKPEPESVVIDSGESAAITPQEKYPQSGILELPQLTQQTNVKRLRKNKPQCHDC